MKFLYVAPRFHTNQMSIMKGLRDNGHDIKFIAHYKTIIEDYSVVEPVVLGYSPLYKLIDFLYVKVIHRKDPEAIVYKIGHGFPVYGKLKKEIKNFSPDVVIVREKSMYSLFTYKVCKKYGYPCILYNQNPYYVDKDEDCVNKQGFLKRMVSSRNLFPELRMTPVLGNKAAFEQGLKKTVPSDKYIPFVMDPEASPSERTYFGDDCVHILCIGKYEIRKHHLELLEIIKNIHDEVDERIRLTLVGEATNDFQKGYLAQVKDFVSNNNMSEYVTVEANVERSEMNKRFLEADIYTIPSTRETASVSQLEAMSYSLPVVCSDTNGTSCYVSDNKTGFLFKDCDMSDLRDKLQTLITDRDLIRSFGAAGYNAVLKDYSFERYFEGITEMIETGYTDEKS